MAKMSKTDLVAFMKNAAQSCRQVTEQTIAEIEAMDYSARRNVAFQLAREVTMPETNPSYEPYGREAFVEKSLSIWAGKETELKHKREAFRRACTGLTTQQATAKVKALLESMQVRGARVSDGYSINMEVERGRCSARLYVKMERDDQSIINPDDNGQRADSYTVTCEIGTTGTSYTLSEMAVMHKIHAELLDAANEVQVLMDREHIIWTYGIPEAVKELTQ